MFSVAVVLISLKIFTPLFGADEIFRSNGRTLRVLALFRFVTNFHHFLSVHQIKLVYTWWTCIEDGCYALTFFHCFGRFVVTPHWNSAVKRQCYFTALYFPTNSRSALNVMRIQLTVPRVGIHRGGAYSMHLLVCGGFGAPPPEPNSWGGLFFIRSTYRYLGFFHSVSQGGDSRENNPKCVVVLKRKGGYLE